MNRHTTFLEKIFIWSLITEPFKYFILSSPALIGISLTLSKSLQLVFLIGYLFNFIFRGKGIPKINPFDRNYAYLTLFIIVSLIAGIYGFLSGQYHINTFNVSTTSINKRAFFEIFIILYYYLYFLILPIYIIRSKVQLSYFFLWTNKLIYFVVALGLIEFICYQFLSTNLIPRHLTDSNWVDVGNRFHSILGEPRHAFVYLVFSIAFLYLRQAVTNKKLSYIYLSILILCCILTKAFSGVAGIIFGIILLAIYTKISFKNLIAFFLISIVSFVAIVISVKYSVRIDNYYQMLLTLPDEISKVPLPYFLHAQAPELIPLWLFANRIIDVDLIYVLIGSGIASSSYAINNFLSTFMVGNNPNAQLVRLVYDAGVIGTYLYLMVLINPIRRFLRLINFRNYQVVWISSILLIGASFGVRSNLPFIYSGILLAIITNNLINSELNKDD